MVSTIHRSSEVPFTPGLKEVNLPFDLTDLELFKQHCVPFTDPWDDVSRIDGLQPY